MSTQLLGISVTRVSLARILGLALTDPHMFVEELLRRKKTQSYQYTQCFHSPVKDGRLVTISQDFDLYRKCYNGLSFEDLKRLNTIWYDRYPSQKYFDAPFVRSCMRYLIRRLRKKSLFVAEMGGYQGELAYEILKDFSRITWRNYEIIPHRRVRELARYDYEEVVLTKPLWLEEIGLEGCDAFIMSDTIEHLTDEEANKIFSMFRNLDIKSVIIKSPLSPKGQTWHNYFGSHLLRMGSDQLKSIFARDYQLKKEFFDCHFWIRRRL